MHHQEEKKTYPETNAPGDEYKPTHKQPSIDYGLRGSFSLLPMANKAASFHSSRRKNKYPQRQTPLGMCINLLRNEQTFDYGLRGSFSPRSTAIPLEYLHQSRGKIEHPRRQTPPGMNTNLLTNNQALTTACAGASHFASPSDTGMPP